MTTTDPVEAAFQAFQNSSNVNGVWPKLTRKSLINQFQARYENPYSVHQQDMYLCGPAAIVFVLFLKDPARSVQICQSLFEKGEIGPPLTSGKTIRAAEALRKRDLPPNISQVDWMLVATLREAENLFFTVDPQASKLVQMAAQVTTAFAMENWAREVLFYTHVESTSCNFFGETDAMQKAEAAVARGDVPS